MLGVKSLQETLGLDMLQSLGVKALPTGEAEVNATPPLSKTTVTSGDMRGSCLLSWIGVNSAVLQAADREAGEPEIPDAFQEALISRQPEMFIESDEELAARREALDGAVAVALAIGMPSEDKKELHVLVFDRYFDAFRRRSASGTLGACEAHACYAEGEGGSGACEEKTALVYLAEACLVEGIIFTAVRDGDGAFELTGGVCRYHDDVLEGSRPLQSHGGGSWCYIPAM